MATAEQKASLASQDRAKKKQGDIASGEYSYGRHATGKYFITSDGRIVTVDQDGYSRNISVDDANKSGLLKHAGFNVDSKGRFYFRGPDGYLRVFRSAGNQLVEMPEIREINGVTVDTSNYELGSDGHYYRKVSGGPFMRGYAPQYYRINIDPTNRSVTYDPNQRYQAFGNKFNPIYTDAEGNDTVVNPVTAPVDTSIDDSSSSTSEATPARSQATNDAAERLKIRKFYSNMSKDDIKGIQQALNQLGFNAGDVDGIVGQKTISAIKEFQRMSGIGVDGMFGKDSQKTLRAQLLNSRIAREINDQGAFQGVTPFVTQPISASVPLTAKKHNGGVLNYANYIQW